MIFQPTQENIELLTDGEGAFSRIIQGIRSAERSIYINVFIWRDDEIGNEIAKELLEATNRGVKIFISKDAFGSIYEKAEANKQSFFHKENRFSLWARQKLIDLFYHMPGEARTAEQRPNNLVDLFMNNKNIKAQKELIKYDHSKYYIFDDEIIILGGMNIDNREADSDSSGRKWNDYMCAINGKKNVDRFKQRLSGEVEFSKDIMFDFVINKNGSDRRFEIKLKIIELLSMAKNKAYIEMAYFGDKIIIDKIVEAAGRGVEVVIITSQKANLQADFNLKIMREILERTRGKITVYLCRNMIHAKVINIDEKITLFGSANLNKYCMDKFDEIDVLINGDGSHFTNKLIQNINAHIGMSEKITDPAQIKFDRFRAFLEGLIAG